MKKLNNKGFTLVELLVVIGILTVLLAAILVAINPVRQFSLARDSQRRNDVLTILNAVQQNMADHKGNFGTDTGVTIPATAAEISDTGANFCQYLMPTYVASLPVDPNTGSPIGGASCPATYTTKYFISQDAQKRVTVSYKDATGTPETTGTSNIIVTR